MVKSLGRLLAIPALVLPLASCIFALSAFPPTLSQILARADLSGTILAGTGSQYQPYIVTPTGGEFVILLNRNMSGDPAAVVMNSNLNVIQTYMDAELTGWGISPGGTLMTDAAGHVAFSNGWFRAADLATVNPPFGVGTPALFGANFSSPAANANVANFQVSGNTLTYSRYDSLWGLVFAGAGILVNGAGGNYNVEAVYDVDDTPSAGEVVLILSDFSNSLYFVAIPLVDILNNSVASPLFSYPSTTLTNINSSSIGFAGDSLVAYNYNSSSLIRYSVKAPFNQISSLSLGNNNGNNSGNLQYAYKTTGGYSVVYDANARKLTKVANWW